jgi:hypothetical protein
MSKKQKKIVQKKESLLVALKKNWNKRDKREKKGSEGIMIGQETFSPQ